MYYVNDGVYGSFNCLLYDHAEVEPTLIDVSLGFCRSYNYNINCLQEIQYYS